MQNIIPCGHIFGHTVSVLEKDLAINDLLKDFDGVLLAKALGEPSEGRMGTRWAANQFFTTFLFRVLERINFKIAKFYKIS